MQMPDGATLIGPTDMPELCWAPSGGYYVGRIRREPPSGTLLDGAALIGPTDMPELCWASSGGE